MVEVGHGVGVWGVGVWGGGAWGWGGGGVAGAISGRDDVKRGAGQ